MYVRDYLQGSENGRVVTIVVCQSLLPLSTILVFDFRIFLNLTVWYFFVCRFILTEKFGSRIFFLQKIKMENENHKHR
jgi:hypothetical protein